MRDFAQEYRDREIVRLEECMIALTGIVSWADFTVERAVGCADRGRDLTPHLRRQITEDAARLEDCAHRLRSILDAQRAPVQLLEAAE